jgi:hypothetical protein
MIARGDGWLTAVVASMKTIFLTTNKFLQGKSSYNGGGEVVESRNVSSINKKLPHFKFNTSSKKRRM